MHVIVLFSSEGSDYLPITSLEGNRFYIRLRDENISGELDLKDSVRFGRSTGLCGVPYMDLLDQASMETSKSLQVSATSYSSSIIFSSVLLHSNAVLVSEY